MQGRLKKFDPALAEWASRAERELPAWLRRNGYEIVIHPHGTKGVDIVSSNPMEKFYVDVERRSMDTWPDDRDVFPYKTINVPERKGSRYDSSVVFFTLRRDLRKAVVIFPQSLDELKPVEHPNKYLGNGELFYQVPMQQTLTIDLGENGRTLAEMNAERIRSYLRSVPEDCGGGAVVNEMLGSRPPYGMHELEWQEWWNDFDERRERLLGWSY